MWPSTKGGVDLSFGHDGGGIYVPHMNPDQPWQFARAHGRGVYLYERSSRVLVPPVVLSSGYKPKRSKRRLAKNLKGLRGAYVPLDLMDEYNRESNDLASPLMYDPVVGNLMSLGQVRTHPDIKKHYDSKTGIGFVTGRHGNAVKFAHLVKPRDGVVAEPQLEHEFLAKMDNKVLQVELWNPSQSTEETSICPYALVRTPGKTSVLRIGKKRDFGNYGVTAEITPSSQEAGSRETQAHAVLSPHSPYRLATIDEAGCWRVHTIGEKTESSCVTGLPHPTRLQHGSKWNKVVWGQDLDSLVVANRLHAKYVDTRSLQSNIIHECDYNLGHVCDIARSPLNERENFILTSSKLLWTDIRVPNKTIMTWDHFMDKSDWSLRFDVCKMKDDIAMVTLHSQLLQANTVFQFTYANGLPISAEDPFCFRATAELVTQSLGMMPLTQEETNSDEKAVVAFRFSKDHGLISQHLSTQKPESCEYEHIQYASRKKIKEPKSKPKTVHDFSQLYKELFKEVPDVDAASARDERLRQFTKILGERINNLHTSSYRGIYTLFELSEPKVLFEDVNELAEMLQQLKEHYKNTTIKVFPLVEELKNLFRENIKEVPDIYEHLLELWVSPLGEADVPDMVSYRRQKLSWHIAMGLALSSIGAQCHSPKETPAPDSVLDKYTGSNMKPVKLKSATRRLLSEWDDGGSTDQYQWFRFEMDEEERRTQMALSQQLSAPPPMPPSPPSQLPAIATTSQRTPTTRRKKRKRQEGFV